jgi:hypothetical protein
VRPRHVPFLWRNFFFYPQRERFRA